MSASRGGTGDIALIPYPRRLKRREASWELKEAAALQASTGLAGELAYLAGILRRATGFPVPVSESVSTAAIRLSLRSELEILGREGYRLEVGESGVELQAASATGIFRGIQTLLQLFPPSIYGTGPRAGAKWLLPQIEIEDAPRFSWRGAMLDCSRHFRPVAFIRKFIDELAYHKLNVFHWHLTDDQGWRIEIKKYPRLTEIGAWRKGTWLGHREGASRHDGIPHGGYYAQEDVREIVRYAAERHITIVPEIEMPGHAQAAVAAYPELGCTDQPVEVWTEWGVSENIYRPDEKVFRFLEDVLTEVLELFPSTFIHIGGDEAAKRQWDESPDIQALMKAAGVKDSHEMQSYFIRHFDTFLAKRGRRLIGWDEILEGGLAEGASVMSWRGMEGGLAAAQQGHDVVMTPTSHTYLDAYQSRATDCEPLAIGGFVPLETAHAFEPVPPELPADKARHILGMQGQLWGEYIPTVEHLEYMAFPRLAALAEVGWCDLPRRDFAAFRRDLSLHLKRLDIRQVRYRSLDSDVAKS
jgi:hexosaminidase